MLRIIANGVDLDLFPDSNFYVSKQVHNLNDLNTRNGDTSKTLTIPRTGTNERTLEAYFHQGQNREGYAGQPGIVTFDGIDIIQKGVIFWDNLTPTTIDITFFWSNAELFLSIGDMLSDLDLDSYNFTLDVAGANGIKSNTTGVVYPRADWMDIFASRFLRSTTAAGWNQNIDINLSGFFFYAATLIEEIIQQAGFTLNIDDVNSDIYDYLALACPVTDFTQLDPASTQAQVSNLTQNLTPGTTRLIFSVIDLDPNLIFSGPANYEFAITIGTAVSVYLTVNGTFSKISGGNAEIEIINGSTIIAKETINASGSFSVNIQADSDSDTSGIFYARAVINPASTMAITDSQFAIYSRGANPSRDIVVSERMPELTQGDFLKGILAHQNIILSTNPLTRVVTFLSFEDIKLKEQQDWSDKLLLNKDIIESNTIGSYGTKNLFNYDKQDDLFRTGIDGHYDFDDERLQKIADIINLPFEGSDSSRRYTSTTNVAALLGVYELDVIEPSATITQNSGVIFTTTAADQMNIGDFIVSGTQTRRVVSITSSTAGTVSSNFSPVLSGATFFVFRFKKKDDVIKLCNIEASADVSGITNGDPTTGGATQTDLDATFNNEMLFTDLIETNYSNTMAALNRPLVLNASFIFDMFEFSTIDLLKPVYISSYGALFFINKIDQYVPNKPVLVELIRI